MSLWNQIEKSGTVGFVQQLIAGGSVVYGVVLNDSTSLKQLGDELGQAPYNAPPKAPAMYIKPRNTIVGGGAVVTLPQGEHSVEVGAVLGVVIGKPASRVPEDRAGEYIAGYVAVADLSLPHDSYYRPAIREKCFDGACPIGESIPAGAVTDIALLEMQTFINGELVATRSLADLYRSVPQLISDISEFMTLKPNDIVLTGVVYKAPQAKVGDSISVEAGPVGSVAFSLAGQVVEDQA